MFYLYINNYFIILFNEILQTYLINLFNNFIFN